jgi:hypothetical protein
VKCAICGTPCDQAFLRLGGYCGEEHRDELLKRHRQRLDELRHEDVRAMPEVLAVPDFERLALKLAVHLLDRMNPTLRALYRAVAPSLLDPLEMAAELKGLILRQLPASHVTLEEAAGLQRLFFDGTYAFPQPVPACLVLEALEKTSALLGLA